VGHSEPRYPASQLGDRWSPGGRTRGASSALIRSDLPPESGRSGGQSATLKPWPLRTGSAVCVGSQAANGVPNEVPDSAEVTRSGTHSTARIRLYRAQQDADRATLNPKVPGSFLAGASPASLARKRGCALRTRPRQAGPGGFIPRRYRTDGRPERPRSALRHPRRSPPRSLGRHRARMLMRARSASDDIRGRSRATASAPTSPAPSARPPRRVVARQEWSVRSKRPGLRDSGPRTRSEASTRESRPRVTAKSRATLATSYAGVWKSPPHLP
jgi:hypothetical protein